MRPYKWHGNRENFHELIAGTSMETETNFLKDLKMPDSDRGVETFVFG
jgi:hypothetical protein